jgi:hypothetical protein
VNTEQFGAASTGQRRYIEVLAQRLGADHTTIAALLAEVFEADSLPPLAPYETLRQGCRRLSRNAARHAITLLSEVLQHGQGADDNPNPEGNQK